ncbi:hypothetical protein QYE76_053031 [Lolium multiflorum]|uniref:Integrase catalytic domain-containing protein n=1 Tax=Lolium multiflorum TaxID=4521 RepID=A0AAD8SV59_LOLMU|nr:hypothetical protein QYE76_053031 [Lolium multiflorum]
MLQLYLIGPARIWLSDLEENSIFCWFDLKKAFENHFRGTYKRPATTSDLQACIQKKGETSRSFLTRWLATRNECENVDNRTAMHAFIGGLQRGGLLRHKLTCLVNANKLTLDEMINIASDHTAADDDAGGDLAATAIPLHQQKKTVTMARNNNNKRKNPLKTESGGSDMAAMTFQPGGGRGRGRGGGAGRGQQRADEVTAAGSRAPQTYEEYRDMSCLAHLDPATGKSTHTNRNCKWVNDLKNDQEAGYKHRPRGKGGKGKNKDKKEDSSEAMDEDDASPDPKEATAANKSNPFGKKSVGAFHTFLGTPTVCAKKSALRLLNAIVPTVPQYVKWSEKARTFDRSDHPAVIPKECYALVVSPRIDGYDFSKCLMDGRASLNIMYLETLERMNLTKEQLKHITTEFHGVVPVVPFKSSYHVIFGRPTYHKFHARACYIYNKLKIPGPNDGIEILREIHSGDCGHHAAPSPQKLLLGFYLLTNKEDAEKLVKTCRGCQYYATQPNAPAQELKTIPITWPFAVWGLDMVGKLKKSSPGGHEYLLVAIDKFSKWIEAKPVRKADGATALKFVCSLVTRFGIPHSIITDNDTNFAQGELKDYCNEVGIRLDLASVLTHNPMVRLNEPMVLYS